MLEASHGKKKIEHKFKSMKKRINTKLKMYTAVIEICKKHETSWETIPGFVNTVGEFETILGKLKNNASKQITVTKGISQAKEVAIKELYEHLMLIHAALAIHAKQVNDHDLMFRNTINISDLNHLTIPRLEFHLDRLLADLTEHGTYLLPFGLDAAFLQETSEMITLGRLQSTRPRMSIIERSQLTKSLDESISKLDVILKFKMDPLMRLFKKSVPDFYDLYFKARIIIDQGNKKASPSKGLPPAEPDDGY